MNRHHPLNGNQKFNNFLFKYYLIISLEITKFLHSIKDKRKEFKLEVFDTNNKIALSLMILSKSRLIKLLLAYMKLCHGFFLIVENNNFESLKFFEIQLENMKKFPVLKKQNIILIINNKTKIQQQQSFYDSLIKSLENFDLLDLKIFYSENLESCKTDFDDFYMKCSTN